MERLGQVNSAGMESLTTERSRQRFGAFRIPEHIFVVNCIGIPVTGTISSLGNLGFSRLRKHGPNDGITLLADWIFPSGVTVVELAATISCLMLKGRDYRSLNEHNHPLDRTKVRE